MSDQTDPAEEALFEAPRASKPSRPRSRRPAPTRSVARVVVDTPLPHLDHPFDYRVPESLDQDAVPGCRVRVRFNGQLLDGFLLERADTSDFPGRLAYLHQVVSPEPVLTPEIAALARIVADHYAGTLSDVLDLQLSAGNSLRLFVPQSIDPNDPDRGPATLPSIGVTTTLSQFTSQGGLAARAGFNQLQSIGETQFTSPAETLVRTLQNQTGTVQTGLDIDWVSFDADVSLFGTLEPAVCLPADQRDEEESTPEC